LEASRLEEEDRRMAAERSKVERETKERLSALELLDTLMDSQRKLQEEHERSSLRVEQLRKKHEKTTVSGVMDRIDMVTV